MVERVKLRTDPANDPNRSKTGTVRPKTKPARTLGPASRARKKGTFTRKDGDHPPPAKGRPPGAENKTTRILKEAVLLAAEQTGENLRGRQGLVGYLRRQARREPRSFMALLARVLPLQVNMEGKVEHEHRHYHSVTEIRQALRERGITVDEIYERPMKVIEHRKDELKIKPKPKSAVERALVDV